MKISALQQARYEYTPKLPGMLRNGSLGVYSYLACCKAEIFIDINLLYQNIHNILIYFFYKVNSIIEKP